MDGYGEAATAEVEAEASPCAGLSSPVISDSPSQNPDGIVSSRRLGLKNSIQTNFGDDYVFQIASGQEISTLAVSLSTNALKFYSPETGQYLGECKGHEGTIHEISFSVPSSPQVDYFVDCHYSLPDDRLLLIGGTTAGTLGYFPVINDPAGAIGPAEAILEGGHTGVVRTVYPGAGTHRSLGQRGIFGWTGGEDGRLCCWRSDKIAEIKKVLDL